MGWDPVLAAQLTQGGMCCDALYYGNEGVGRPTIAEVGPVSDYEPPLAGGDMAAESPVGTMCPMHGSGNGYSTSTVGNVNQVNPSETLLLEGQAFYVSLAPSQYSLPLTSTTAETQTANEAEAVRDAHHIHDENEQGGCGRIVWNPSVFHRDALYGNSWQVWLRLLRNRFPVVEGWHWFC